MINPAPRARSSDLVHPLPLAAVVLLIVNDHLLKGGGVILGWITGKISDVAGLFFFPVLLTVIVEAAWRQPSAVGSRRRIAWFSVLSTGAVFAAIKSVPALAALASRVLGPVVCDPTDLLALGALAFSLRYLLRDLPAMAPPPRWAQAATVLFAATASLATSPVRVVRGYPAWTAVGASTRAVGCAHVQAWISKSGKQGFGVTLRFSTDDQVPCPVQITGARVVLAGETIATLATLPAVATPPPTAYVYLPFGFDNEAAWNDRKSAAELQLVLSPAGGPEIPWAISLEHRFEGYHVPVPPNPTRESQWIPRSSGRSSAVASGSTLSEAGPEGSTWAGRWAPPPDPRAAPATPRCSSPATESWAWPPDGPGIPPGRRMARRSLPISDHSTCARRRCSSSARRSRSGWC